MEFDKIDFTIKTERLEIRPLSDKEVKPIFQIANAYPEITKFVSWDVPKEIKETENFVKGVQKAFPQSGVCWGIFINNEYKGNISLDGIVRTLNAWKMDLCEMGYWLHPELHGQGVMTEAAKAVLAFGFDKLKLHKIKISHVLENKASARVIEKLGFRKIGIEKQHFYRHGQWWDHVIYELLETEWNKLK